MVADAPFGFQNLEKNGGVENPNHLISQNIRSGADVHDLSCRRVDLLNFQCVVDNDQTVRRVVDDAIGKAFGFFLEIRQTHGDFRLAVIDGNCLFPTGIIPAGTAVQFVLGFGFSHFAQDLGDLVLARRSVPTFDRLKLLAQRIAFGLSDIEVARPRILCNRHVIRNRGAVVFLHYRTADATADTR